jgi:hypothetical protein
VSLSVIFVDDVERDRHGRCRLKLTYRDQLAAISQARIIRSVGSFPLTNSGRPYNASSV